MDRTGYQVGDWIYLALDAKTGDLADIDLSKRWRIEETREGKVKVSSTSYAGPDVWLSNDQISGKVGEDLAA